MKNNFFQMLNENSISLTEQPDGFYTNETKFFVQMNNQDIIKFCAKHKVDIVDDLILALFEKKCVMSIKSRDFHTDLVLDLSVDEDLQTKWDKLERQAYSILDIVKNFLINQMELYQAPESRIWEKYSTKIFQDTIPVRCSCGKKKFYFSYDHKNVRCAKCGNIYIINELLNEN